LGISYPTNTAESDVQNHWTFTNPIVNIPGLDIVHSLAEGAHDLGDAIPGGRLPHPRKSEIFTKILRVSVCFSTKLEAGGG
jgi:hypothetical protein